MLSSDSGNNGFNKWSLLICLLILGYGLGVRLILLNTSFTGNPWYLNYFSEIPLWDVRTVTYHLSRIMPNVLLTKLILCFGAKHYFAYKLTIFIFSAITLIALFFMAAYWLGPVVAGLAVLLLGISNFHWEFTATSLDRDYILLIAAPFITLFFLYLALEKDKLRYWALFCAGATFSNLFLIKSAPFNFVYLFVILYYIAISLGGKEVGGRALKHFKSFSMFYILSIALTIIFYHFQGVPILDYVITKMTTGKMPGYLFYTYKHDFQLGLRDRTIDLSMIRVLLDILSNSEQPNTQASWYFLFFFLVGVVVLFFKRRNLSVCLAGSVLIPVITAQLVFTMHVARYTIYVMLPFFILVAAGFYFTADFICAKARISQRFSGPVALVAGVLLFAVLLPGENLFSYEKILERASARDFKPVLRYLNANMTENDVALNCCDVIDLKDFTHEIKIPLSVTSSYYLRNICKKHLMDSLPKKKGRVGVWFVTYEEIDKRTLSQRPFYWPSGYNPELSFRSSGIFVYHGEIDLDEDGRGKKVFADNPFWTFVYARDRHMRGLASQALSLYEEYTKMGINPEPALFNMGQIHAVSGNFDTALLYYEKAMHILLSEKMLNATDKKISERTRQRYLNPADGVTFRVAKEEGTGKERMLLKDKMKYTSSLYINYFLSPVSVCLIEYFRTEDAKYLQAVLGYIREAESIWGPESRGVKELKKLLAAKQVFLLKSNFRFVMGLGGVGRDF